MVRDHTPAAAPGHPAAADPALFTFFNEIGIIDQLARAAFERILPPGMTVPQFSVLNHFVRLGGPKTPAQLAQAFQVSRATMTNTLQRLEASGLIASTPDPHDKRSKQIAITAAGRRMRARCIAALAPLLAALETRMDIAAVTRALPVLQAVRARLDTSRDLAAQMAGQAGVTPED